MFALTLTTLATMTNLALAIPLTASTTINATEDNIGHIFKRGEGVHLVNCGNAYSAVVYCANDSNCNFFPGSGNQCIPSNGGITVWEGSNQRCTFPGTGTEFKWFIQGDAQRQNDYTRVGSGDNGFHGFTIFKDDKHTMYRDGNGHECKSIYYCLP